MNPSKKFENKFVLQMPFLFDKFIKTTKVSVAHKHKSLDTNVYMTGNYSKLKFIFDNNAKLR
jgi:hypothetical protein